MNREPIAKQAHERGTRKTDGATTTKGTENTKDRRGRRVGVWQFILNFVSFVIFVVRTVLETDS